MDHVSTEKCTSKVCQIVGENRSREQLKSQHVSRKADMRKSLPTDDTFLHGLREERITVSKC